MVALCTALYLTGPMRQLLAQAGHELGGVDAPLVERSIRPIRTDLVLGARMVRATRERIVAGKSDVPGKPP